MNATQPSIHKTPLIYVSGAYTAETFEQVQENIALALEVGYAVQALGCEPLVPHISCPPPKATTKEGTWKRAMRSCLVQMLRCDAVLMVPNWKESRGARVERWVALKAGLPVYDCLTHFTFSRLAQT